MRIEKLRELEPGQEVTVITTGDFQLVDVASSLKFPPLTEVTTTLTPFIENQLRLGNMTLNDQPDAPKAKGKAVSDVNDLNYEAKGTADASLRVNRVEARGGSDELTSTNAKRGRKASETEE